MLYINNPEALLAIAEDRRKEFGQRPTSDPDQLPTGASTREASRPRSIVNRFHRIASTGYATS